MHFLLLSITAATLARQADEDAKLGLGQTPECWLLLAASLANLWTQKLPCALPTTRMEQPTPPSSSSSMALTSRRREEHICFKKLQRRIRWRFIDRSSRSLHGSKSGGIGVHALAQLP